MSVCVCEYVRVRRSESAKLGKKKIKTLKPKQQEIESKAETHNLSFKCAR